MTNFADVIQELQTYTGLDNTKVGDAVDALCDLYSYRDILGHNLVKNTEQELLMFLEMYKTNFRIVIHTETFDHTYNELEYIGA